MAWIAIQKPAWRDIILKRNRLMDWQVGCWALERKALDMGCNREKWQRCHFKRLHEGTYYDVLYVAKGHGKHIGNSLKNSGSVGETWAQWCDGTCWSQNHGFGQAHGERERELCLESWAHAELRKWKSWGFEKAHGQKESYALNHGHPSESSSAALFSRAMTKTLQW